MLAEVCPVYVESPMVIDLLHQMMQGCWNACYAPSRTGRTFAADAIISNPPAFAHVHCAEALGIPLLMTFTMPWWVCFPFAPPAPIDPWVLTLSLPATDCLGFS